MLQPERGVRLGGSLEKCPEQVGPGTFFQRGAQSLAVWLHLKHYVLLPPSGYDQEDCPELHSYREPGPGVWPLCFPCHLTEAHGST